MIIGECLNFNKVSIGGAWYYVVAYTTATNCYSGQSLSEKNTMQQLSAKVWNSGTISVDSLPNIMRAPQVLMPRWRH